MNEYMPTVVSLFQKSPTQFGTTHDLTERFLNAKGQVNFVLEKQLASLNPVKKAYDLFMVLDSILCNDCVGYSPLQAIRDFLNPIEQFKYAGRLRKNSQFPGILCAWIFEKPNESNGQGCFRNGKL